MQPLTRQYPARLFALTFFFTALLSGCGYNGNVTNIQDIVELQWRGDGSSLAGFIQKTAVSDVQGTALVQEYNIGIFNNDGSLNKQFSADQKAANDYSFSLFLNSDGSQAITQLGADLYRIDMNSGAATKLTQLFHLLVASPDLHFAVGTYSPDNRPIKTITVLDLTKSPIDTISEFDIPDIKKTSGIWLSGETFGLTIRDSASSHITIFDTSGAIVTTIGGAEAAFHNAKYIPATNTIYFLDRGGLGTDGMMDKVNITTGARQSVLPLSSIESFDVTSDENFMVYNTYQLNTDSVSSTLKLIIRNLSTGQERELTNDILKYCVFSPAADKVAYVRGNVTFNEVKVVTATRP